MSNSCHGRYLLTFQYLGFRFEGVQKHPGLKTIQAVMEERFFLQFPHRKLKLKFSSRTDKMVSCLEGLCLLMIEGPELTDNEIGQFKSALPADILILHWQRVDKDYTLLSAIAGKEYHYYFSHGPHRLHPFAAPFMCHFQEELDILLMQQACMQFVGVHDFSNYCHHSKLQSGAALIREVSQCELSENLDFTASFFPAQSYVLKISGPRFMRQQVRMMVGALVRVGMHELSLASLADSLKHFEASFVRFSVPASGLVLARTFRSDNQ